MEVLTLRDLGLSSLLVLVGTFEYCAEEERKRRISRSYTFSQFLVSSSRWMRDNFRYIWSRSIGGRGGRGRNAFPGKSVVRICQWGQGYWRYRRSWRMYGRGDSILKFYFIFYSIASPDRHAVPLISPPLRFRVAGVSLEPIGALFNVSSGRGGGDGVIG